MITLPKLFQALFILFVSTFIVNAQEKAVEILTDRSIDWKQPEVRLKAALRIREIENRNYQKAKALAKSLGKPVTENLPGGKVRWLDGIDENGELLYHETRNINAAISTGADKVNSSPYNVDGSGLRIGVWENNSPRATHQEFMETGTSRINNVQSLGYGDHATHVGGIIAAFGVNPSAKGMAFKSNIDAYRAGNDESYMPVAGAVSAGQLDSRVYVSNHSYGPTYGWEVLSGKWTWKGEGTDENAADSEFGQYSSTSRSIDAICYNTPYYLPFWASGNERVNGPSNGTISRIGGVDVAYNSAIHPAYDNNYRNGYETMGDETISKNVVTVGATKDAVTNGVRDTSKAEIAYFSSTGPTDDGRIKPDLVGNGTNMFSTYNGGDTSYSTQQGTSMATPNVVGTAGLLVGLYRDLFAGSSMRASTLKALLIHTASDLGNPGPDYLYGWGLPDAGKAAALLQTQADFPALKSVNEDQLSTAQPAQTFDFSWDGVSPIRATLCWTDPAGAGESAHDDRSPDLVNDLNLKLIAPDGTEYFPFVMPFVGTWTVASMSQNATTGVNHTDNVEQVLVSAPAQMGNWQVEVSYLGALTNNAQDYGLIISGAGTSGALELSSSDYSVGEGDGFVTITVNRIDGATGAVSVDYATSDGTAVAGSDFTTTTGTLNWADGEDGAKTFNVSIINDAVSENYEESFQVALSNPVGIFIAGASSATATIIDDEPAMGVQTPNGGEDLLADSSYAITWLSSLGGDVRIELLRNDILYTTVAESTANDGSFNWTVSLSAPTAGDYRIRITSLAGGGESDVSNETFAINNDTTNYDIYTANMDTDPGWTLDGNWGYGTPTGGNGTHGNPDPTSGFTGSNVIGYNLTGGYEAGITGELYAATPAIDCSAYSSVQLSFYRWLNVEGSQYDHAAIRVSNDGVSWTEIWSNGATTLTANSWSQVSYDISAVADGQSTVYVRWVMGPTDSDWQYSGWNIDDVVVSGLGAYVNPAGEVAFSSGSYTVSEDGGSASITVDRIGGSSGAISVDYATSDGTATAGSDYITTSGTLSWADGDGASKTFSVAINDDAIREGVLETVEITLSNLVGATLTDNTPATLEIQDNDNNVPTVDAGQGQTVYLTAVPWTPARMTTALWVDADEAGSLTLDGTSVTQWNDKSGNGNHLAQATGTEQPTSGLQTIGGRNAVDFNDDFMQTTASNNNIRAVFFVSDNLNGSNTNANVAPIFGEVTINQSYTFVRTNTTDYSISIDGSSVVTGAASIFGNTPTTGNNIDLGLSVTEEEAPVLWYVEYDASVGMDYLGQLTSNQSFDLIGTIGEFIALESVPSEAERQMIEGYLAHKWDLAANLPEAHPYKGAAPYIGTAAVADLNGTASDLDGDDLTTEWTFVSGPQGIGIGAPTAQDTTASFTAAGTYVLELTADDGIGQATDQVTVTVISAHSGEITYVDAVEGASGNTFATGGSLSDTSWLSGDTGATQYNNLWKKRAFASDGTIIASRTSANDSQVELTTRLTGLSDGVYSIWAFFWDNSSSAWDLAAGLSPGLTSADIYSHDGLGDTQSPIPASVLSFDPLSAPTLTAEGDRIMYAVYLGQSVVSGGSAIDIYIDDLTDGSQEQRTWYDGVAYTRVGNLNAAPVFTADPIVGADATENVAYAGSLAGSATDAEGDPLGYAKVSGPAWLFVATDGTLSGTPTGSDVGANAFTVSASDGIAALVEAVLNITVVGANPSAYGGWATTHPSLSDDSPDVDFDTGGTSTGLEWVLGGDPTNGSDDSSILPTVSNDPVTNFMVMTFRRSDEAFNDPNTSITVEYGNNLLGWTPAEHNGSSIIFNATDDGAGVGIDLIEVRIDRGLVTGDRIFARINVVVSP